MRRAGGLLAAIIVFGAQTPAAAGTVTAAVAANFEMMTRLADGTGARLPEQRLEQAAAQIDLMGTGDLVSRR